MKKYPTHNALLNAWNDGTGIALDERETLGNVERKEVKDLKERYLNARFRDNIRFYGDMDVGYWVRLKTYCRDELGVKCKISVGNNYYGLYFQKLMADYSDWVDQHEYRYHLRRAGSINNIWGRWSHNARISVLMDLLPRTSSVVGYRKRQKAKWLANPLFYRK